VASTARCGMRILITGTGDTWIATGSTATTRSLLCGKSAQRIMPRAVQCFAFLEYPPIVLKKSGDNELRLIFFHRMRRKLACFARFVASLRYNWR
jgi:hypothetical protein